MPTMKLHEKAKKKFNSWGRKKKPKTDNPPDDLGAKPAEFPPPPAPPVFADLACAFGPDDFLDGACSRDAEKSDSTTSPGPPSPCSPPCLSPADGMVDGDQFINKLFSDIIPGNDDTSDCDTDGERTLVGDDLSRPETPSLASDGDEVFLSPRSDSSGGLDSRGAAGGYRNYCGSVGSLLGQRLKSDVSDDDYHDDDDDDDSVSDTTLLNFTISSDDEDTLDGSLSKETQFGAERDTLLSHSRKHHHHHHHHNHSHHQSHHHPRLSHSASVPNVDEAGSLKQEILSHSESVPNLKPFPRMRAMPPTLQTLTEIHSMLDLPSGDLPSSSLSSSASSACRVEPTLPLSHSMPDLSTETAQSAQTAAAPPPAKRPTGFATPLDSKPPGKSRTTSKSSTGFRTALDSKPPAKTTRTSKSSKESSDKRNRTSRNSTGDAEDPRKPTDPFSVKSPVDTQHSSSVKSGLVDIELPSSVKSGPSDSTKTVLSRWKSTEVRSNSIPEALCLCNCEGVCETDVEVKHVEIRALPADSSSFSSSSALPAERHEPVTLLGVYKIKVCHHPQCTEDNKDLPLLLCRQCDVDIHRNPGYSGHLVLDVSGKRGGGYNRPSRSPAESDSGDDSHHDEDVVDGRQLFVKKPSKDYRRNRSPSEVERKLKRKKAVKKKSFSKNDSQTYGLEAALAQIACPEGPDLMANLTAETEGEGSRESSDLARKDSTSEPSLVSQQESIESSPHDPGLPPHPRTPIRRQSRVALQDNYFTIKVCGSGDSDHEDLEVVAAVSNTSLRDALEPILERRGIDINTVNAFIEKSNTPLPLSSDTSFLAGNTLEIKEKDDRDNDMVTQGSGAKQRPSSASKASASSSSNKAAKSAGRNSRRDSIGIPTLLEPPPSKQRRGSLQLPFREHFFNSQSKSADVRSFDDPFGSLRSRRGQNLSIDDTYSIPSTSPQGTLTFSEGGKKPRSQKLSVVSLFANNSSNKDREKHEQLHEILSGYSNNGLPPLPELLNLGRPTFDEAAFNMEAHWSILVDNASALTKRQHDQQEAVWELLQTELSYISQIRVIIDVFKSCLLNVQQESLLNEIETERLFSNIDKILESNCKLWQDSLCKVLEDARSHHHPLNPSIMKPSFTREFQKVVDPYTRYCMEQKQCLEYMKARHSDNDLFKIFVVWAEQQKQCNRLKLTDLLVKPMQRLTKYSLLLQAILRKTDDERQRRDLLEMIASVDKYVTSINSQMQQQHELERLEAIMTKIEAYDAVEAPNDECVKIIQEYNTNFNLMAPMSGFHITHTRALLMHSSLRMKESQSRTDVDCFLFTDLILICKSSKRMDKFKIIRPPMRLDRIVVSELRDKGSFLLIYMNEYHIPISAYSFHGDQAAVRVWLEKIREAQTDYGRQKLEDQTQHRLSQAAAVTEEVVYSPLPGTTPLTMEHTPAVSFPRSQSMESTEGRFIPNITPARSPTTENSSPEKSPPPSQRTPAALERTGSCNEFSPASLNMTRVVNQSRHASSSPEFSPSTDRRHKPVKACHSVPNMSGGQLQIVDNDDDDIGDTGLTMDVMSVNAAVGSLSLSQTNLAEPGPVDDDYNSKLNKLNQRRVSRTEKRYYTADSIQELRRTEKDSSIHKRLSWQNENHLEGKLRKKVLSSDSVHSIPSSSGVSSTASLHLNPESDISEETELAHKRDDSQISNPDMRNDLSPSHLASQGHNTKAKSSPDIVLLFNSLTTGEQEQGISSVGLPAVVDGERQGKKLTHAQLLKMKKQLLLNTDVEASEV